MRVSWVAVILGGAIFSPIAGCSGSDDTGASRAAGGPADASDGSSSSPGGVANTGGLPSIGGTSGAGGSSGRSGSGGAAAPCSSGFESTVGGLCVANAVTVDGGYSIDATEVTSGQYREWLATKPALPSPSDPNCGGWKTSYEPDATCEMDVPLYSSTNPDENPVVCVDWCDASAYCSSVGKRLCGKIGGGANAIADYNDASKSQWYRACSSGGLNAYPYGNTRDGNACNCYDHPGTNLSILPVGSLSTCSSQVKGYQGVYDLSGNVYEWEDSCDAPGKPGYCLIGGGAVVGQSNCDIKIGNYRDTTFSDIGIRCCSR